MVNALFSEAARSAVYHELHRGSASWDHYTLLGQLIKAALAANDRWSINSTDLTQLLNVTFGFDLPRAAIRIAVTRVLAPYLQIDGKDHYTFSPDLAASLGTNSITATRLSLVYRDMLAKLLDHLQTRPDMPAGKELSSLITNSFYQYVFDNEHSDIVSREIRKFIDLQLKTEHHKLFSNALFRIRRADVLYEGIRSSPQPGDLGRLEASLHIFLGHDLLLNAQAAEGSPEYTGFYDLYKLIAEVNKANKRKFRPHSIRLRYLEETRQQCRRMFNDPVKSARFERELHRLGITLFRFTTPENNYLEYGLHDTESIQRAKSLLSLDEAFCSAVLRVFSKINYLRKEILVERPEDSRFIFLTDELPVLQLACHTRIPFPPRFIPFAVEVDHLTNSLWLRLQKGFGSDPGPVIDFEVIARTHSALHQFFSRSLYTRYKQRLKTLKQGKKPKKDGFWQVTNNRDVGRNDDPDGPFFPYLAPKPPSDGAGNPDRSLEFLLRNKPPSWPPSQKKHTGTPLSDRYAKTNRRA